MTEYLNSRWEDSGGADETDDGKWDGSVGAAGVTAVIVYSGSYALEAAASAVANAYVHKAFAADTHRFARAYVRFAGFPSVNGQRNTVLELLNAGDTDGASIGVINDGGTIKWDYYYSDNGGWTEQKLASPLPALNTWYCVELEIVCDASGEHHLYINNIEVANDTGDTSGYTVGLVKAGVVYQSTKWVHTVYVDNVIVADAYVGLYVGSKTFTVGAKIVQRNTKTFTTSARIVWQNLKTFTAGATVQKTYTKSLTASARIVYQQLKTFTAGARIIWQPTKTFTAGATIQKTYTKTFTVGATIRPELSDQCFSIVSTNKIPSKGNVRFRAYNGGSLRIEDFASADIKNELKVWHSMIPFTQFDDIYKEAEDCTLADGADTEDLGDDITTSARLNAQNETVYWDLAALPEGRYVVLVRAKDTNQVASDLQLSVENTTDVEFRNQENDDVLETVTADFAYYMLVFDITAADVSGVDNIRIAALKATATANVIYIDNFLVIPVSNGECWMQDIAHNLLRSGGQKFVLRRKT